MIDHLHRTIHFAFPEIFNIPLPICVGSYNQIDRGGVRVQEEGISRSRPCQSTGFCDTLNPGATIHLQPTFYKAICRVTGLRGSGCGICPDCSGSGVQYGCVWTWMGVSSFANMSYCLPTPGSAPFWDLFASEQTCTNFDFLKVG